MVKAIRAIKLDAQVEFEPGYKEINPAEAERLLAEIMGKFTVVVEEYFPANHDASYQLNPASDQPEKSKK